MTESLDLTRDLRDLVDLAADRSSLDDVLRRGLDALSRIVKYDLGVVFVLDHGKLISRVARGALEGSRGQHDLPQRLLAASLLPLREILDHACKAFGLEQHECDKEQPEPEHPSRRKGESLVRTRTVMP